MLSWCSGPPTVAHIGRDGVGDVLAVGLGVGKVRAGEAVGILRGTWVWKPADPGREAGGARLC
jgi:NADPH:quinone reductase-like Zn-dependent oxidoreductase